MLQEKITCTGGNAWLAVVISSHKRYSSSITDRNSRGVNKYTPCPNSRPLSPRELHGATNFVCLHYERSVCLRQCAFIAMKCALCDVLMDVHVLSVAFCSPAKSLTFSGLMENPSVGKKLKS